MTPEIKELLKAPILLEPNNFTDHMWGGDWIPRFKGIKPSPGVTVGESWEFSARPEHPTMIKMPSGGRISLRELIQAAPDQVLGRGGANNSGAGAPILVKFIDARDNLSLQVHPTDEYALEHEKDSGKSEAWIILDTDSSKESGFIYVGFNPTKAADFPTAAEFEEAFFNALNQANAQGPSTDPHVGEKSARIVLPFLNKIPVRPGEVYEIRPGTPHILGKGVRMFEIQQSSDLTYRVWDWNRPDANKLKQGKLEFRPLHIDKAKVTLNFKAESPESYRLTAKPVQLEGEEIVSEEILVVDQKNKFGANRIRLTGKNAHSRVKTGGSFQVLTVIQGRVEVGVSVEQGHSMLLPACLDGIELKSAAPETQIIRSYVPA